MQWPFENGGPGQRGSECAEHERKNEKGHAGRVETEDHCFACRKTNAENRRHDQSGQERLGSLPRWKSALHWSDLDREARAWSKFWRLIQPKAIRLSGNVPMVMKPKGPGDARTLAFSNATLSSLSVVEKLVFTVCINFHGHSRESGEIVNGTKDPLHAEGRRELVES